MPSVIDAAIKSAEASNSFSPCALLNRPVDRTHISKGMQRMRTNVMELGRFTGSIGRRLRRVTKTAWADYPPRRKRKAMDIGTSPGDVPLMLEVVSWCQGGPILGPPSHLETTASRPCRFCPQTAAGPSLSPAGLRVAA